MTILTLLGHNANGCNLTLFPGLPTNVHEGAQGKHILNHNSRIDFGRSILPADANELLAGVQSDKYKILRFTNGQPPKPIVDFGKPIGIYKNKYTGEEIVTNIGQISSKKRLGAHIIPANPNQY